MKTNRRWLGSAAAGGCGAKIVGIEHDVIALVLRREDALLGQRVVLECAVAIEVVGSDVENDGDGGMELLRGFELEAGDFKHRPCAVGALFGKRNDGDADVAADERRKSGPLEDFAEERGGGRLAIGAGDGENLAFEKAGGELQFADDGAAEALGLHQLGCFERHAGAHDDHVLTAEREQAVTTGLNVDSFFKECRDVFGESFCAADVRNSDLSTAMAQKQCRSQAGLSESYDQHFFAFEFHHEIRPRRLIRPSPLLIFAP